MIGNLRSLKWRSPGFVRSSQKCKPRMHNSEARFSVIRTYFAISTHSYYSHNLRDSYTILVNNLGKKLDAALMTRAAPSLAPLALLSDIPLDPAQEDWEDKIPFWKKKDWIALRYGSRGTLSTDSPVASAFMEDRTGRPVPDEVRAAVYSDVRGFFHDKNKNPETRSELGPREQVGYSISEEFRKLMEDKYPWLRLCEGHWKAAQLWTNVWTSWSTNHGSPNGTPAPDNDEKKAIIGVKRDSTVDSDSPPDPSAKRFKGKGVDRPEDTASKTTFKTRPKPRLAKAKTSFPKVAMVSKLYSLFIHLLTNLKRLEQSVVSIPSLSYRLRY
jgi:hypothetical protein